MAHECYTILAIPLAARLQRYGLVHPNVKPSGGANWLDVSKAKGFGGTTTLYHEPAARREPDGYGGLCFHDASAQHRRSNTKRSKAGPRSPVERGPGKQVLLHLPRAHFTHPPSNP